MNFFVKLWIILLNVVLFGHCCLAQPVVTNSPDGKLKVIFHRDQFTYDLMKDSNQVLASSKLGIFRKDEAFGVGLQVLKVHPIEMVKQEYYMRNAKKSHIAYKAVRRVLECGTPSGKRMNIVFQVSNDGLAFRYVFPRISDSIFHIDSERTTFSFPEGTRTWIQPKAEAQTGFGHSNPSYESYYKADVPLKELPYNKNGWVYPALFHVNRLWVLITEADLGNGYCGTALQQAAHTNEMKIEFPESAERIPGKELNPASTLPWQSPWRIVAVGSLKTLFESTLGTDLAAPSKLKDTDFIEPGKASWSWILEKDDSTIYRVQKRYIDFAADMHWRYCLIDAGWDRTIGYDSIGMLATYAAAKNVSLLLWYNSAGDWNTVKFTPRDKLLTHESRIKEFARLERMGIRGIKVDFFGGDGQSMINYYEDILEDAATYHLMVNFHGATLPRGLQRTYPNLMTTEAVLGYEMSTFSQGSADAAPAHMVLSAFIRNAFDPMDITPVNLYKIPHIKRATTSCFELATSVICLSGIQHYAESPEGMDHMPEFVKSFLRDVPDFWDGVKFIDGYPGKYLVVARRKGAVWYLAGINAENKPITLNLNTSFLKGKKGQLISTAVDDLSGHFSLSDYGVKSDNVLSLTLKSNDGFVGVFK